jgi:glycosyltransferase involved in cell wall biosynthesis
MKISIITSTYNSGATLSDTLSSVLRQSYKNIELIIVDGASTDNTVDIIKKYQDKFEGRLRYISEPDNGLYDAMNKGIRMSTGDVVGILNSDDFYTSSNVLEKVATTLEKKKVDAVYGDVHYVKRDNPRKCVRYYSSRLFRRGWMRLGFMPAHPSFYCRRYVYSKYGMFDTSYDVAADFESLFRFIFINRIKTHYIPIDFVTMRVGGLSSSGLRSHKRIMRDHLRALRTYGVYSNYWMLGLRYFYKAVEVTVTRIRYHAYGNAS